MTPPSEVFIESTDTDPAVRAQARVRQTGQRLRGRLAALSEQEGAAAAVALRDFCAGELRGYLDACDRTLYAAASGAAETRLLVRALRTTADRLGRHIDTLQATGAAAGAAAQAIEVLFAAQLAVEDAVLLPALAVLPGAELPTLAADLQTLLDGGRLDEPDTIDVREIPHGRRHSRIFARFARLAPGTAFTLVNNHDPKPLRREFEATHADGFSWEYVEAGPERWQVRIGRPAATHE
jgi:uncharacterized protein (DUF2249 family)